MRRLLFLGLMAIVPVVLTIYVIIGIFEFADNFLGKFIYQSLS